MVNGFNGFNGFDLTDSIPPFLLFSESFPTRLMMKVKTSVSTSVFEISSGEHPCSNTYKTHIIILKNSNKKTLCQTVV